MSAQDHMTKTKEPESDAKEKPAPKTSTGKKINLTEVFDLLDEIWLYLLNNESRTRMCGRASLRFFRDFSMRGSRLIMRLSSRLRRRASDGSRRMLFIAMTSAVVLNRGSDRFPPTLTACRAVRGPGRSLSLGRSPWCFSLVASAVPFFGRPYPLLPRWGFLAMRRREVGTEAG